MLKYTAFHKAIVWFGSRHSPTPHAKKTMNQQITNKQFVGKKCSGFSLTKA